MNILYTLNYKILREIIEDINSQVYQKTMYWLAMATLPQIYLCNQNDPYQNSRIFVKISKRLILKLMQQTKGLRMTGEKVEQKDSHCLISMCRVIKRRSWQRVSTQINGKEQIVQKSINAYIITDLEQKFQEPYRNRSQWLL